METESDLLKNSSNGIAFFSEKGEYLSSNDIFKKFINRDESTLKGKTITDIFEDLLPDRIKKILEKEKVLAKTININNRTFSLLIFPVACKLKSKILAFLTEIKQKDTLDMKELLNTLIEKSPAGSFIYRETFIFSNKTFQKITGFSEEELKRIKPWEIVHPKFRDEVIKTIKERLSGKITDKHYDLLTIISKDGKEKHLELVTTTIKYQDKYAGMGVCVDRTEKVELEKKLNYLYNHDELTGLPNRKKFIENLQKALDYAQKNSHLVAVILIDIKDFKLINKQYGYETGDRVLVSISKNLEKLITDVDALSRIGDDKFAILLYAFRSFEKLTGKIEDIFRSVEGKYSIDGLDIFIEIKMGISVYPKDGNNPEDLCKNAEIALLKAKKTPGRSFQFFSRNIYSEITRILDLKEKIRKIIDENSILMYYQPIVDLKTGNIDSLEALFRLDNNGENLILPKEIIPVAEETGLIVELGEKILNSVLNFSHKIPDRIKLSVNISSVQLNKPTFDRDFLNILKKADVSPERIVIELTETTIMDNVTENVSKLKNLKDKGVQIAIDDFGTGYSSLNYLKILPVDFLKIDQSFVRGIEADINDEMIVKTIISMAKNMCLKTIAEGVETKEQLDFLQKNGCDYGQGYYFGKPLPEKNTMDILDY
ncbi:EAL domain-containing protein [Persephonella sp.]